VSLLVWLQWVERWEVERWVGRRASWWVSRKGLKMGLLSMARGLERWLVYQMVHEMVL
jgi:hypothetical protein